MRRTPSAPTEALHDRRPRTGSGRIGSTLRFLVLPLAGRLLLAYLVLTAVWAGLGLLLTGPLAGTRVDTMDRDVTHWLADRRTPLLDGLSHAGALLAETLVKVTATAVIVVLLLVVLRSWREPVLVVDRITRSGRLPQHRRDGPPPDPPR